MKSARGLTVGRMAKLGRVSRSSFNRSQEDKPAKPDTDMDLRDAIDRLALEWPCYGRPRITKELRKQGWKVNPKRVHRLMREDNLLCLRKRKFVVTTDSNHGRKIYPNLAAEIAPRGVNQLWVADITYIRLEEEFIFLAVILDVYSRRVGDPTLWSVQPSGAILCWHNCRCLSSGFRCNGHRGGAEGAFRLLSGDREKGR